MNALLHAWEQTLAAWRHEVALTELPGGRSWTFQQLEDGAAAQVAAEPPPPVWSVCGAGASFVISVLAALRCGALLCPREESASPPPPGFFSGAPAEAVLAKFTSGTSGEPKAVLFSAEQLLADVRQIIATMGLRREWPNVAAISMAHSYGFSNLVLPLLVAGVPLRVCASALPEAVRAAAAGGSRVTLAGVPALWRAWVGAGAVGADCVALAISAGAPLPLDLEKSAFRTRGLKIHNFLGSTECGGIAYDRSAVPRVDAAVAGTAMEGVELSTDPEGRLEVRSAAVGLAYWPPQAGGGGLQPGLFQTQDLATLEGGVLRLHGRSGDLVNLAGRKVHPGEIEQVLKGQPGVRECLVFGVPSADPARGEELVACVAPEEPGQPASPAAFLESVRRRAAAELPPWKVPRHWACTPDLHPDARGKLSRRRWRERWRSQPSPPVP